MSDGYQDDLTCAGTNRALGQALWDTYRQNGTIEGFQVVLLDIDGFHRMNLAHGFVAGDEILAHLAERLSQVLPDGAALFRVSVDEFALLLPPSNTPVLSVATNISEVCHTPGTPHVDVLSVSVGAAVATSKHNPIDLVRAAGAALYVARQKKPGRIVHANEINHVYGVAEQEELAVRTALRLGEYVRHYLPLIDVPTRKPIAAEMLVRWQQADMTLRSPATFLRIVQRSGLASEFGAHMFVRACNDWADTLRAAFKPVSGIKPVLAVNIDAEQARQEGFGGLILHLLTRAGLTPNEVVLEVTERVFESPQIAAELQSMRDAGVMVSLDDFGLGSVMLAQLKTLPLDWIKIDQELVASLDAQNPDVSLIKDITQLAGLLGVGVAVEGVETETLFQHIAGLNIPVAQGFLFAEPDTAEHIRQWLQSRQPA